MESAHYWRYHGLGGLDLMRAQFVQHRFARHSHETYAMGTLEAGQEEIRFSDGVQYAGTDEVVVIEPGVVHTGGPHTTDGWTYRVLYPSVEQVREVADEIGVPGGTPSFERRVITDPRMARRVAAAHRAAESGASLAADSQLHTLLTLMLRAYGTRWTSWPTGSAIWTRRPRATTGRPGNWSPRWGARPATDPATSPHSWSSSAKPPGKAWTRPVRAISPTSRQAGWSQRRWPNCWP
ncbi:AraC family ligand binding domain-containing protein [Nonomuraea sp. NPDC049028]|uniref:AraC family ligand binding domain-containing protein n=1 Tax=Nonomuraea sp. NPDC049028 TaxID=3364348 RepID=UPI00371BC967